MPVELNPALDVPEHHVCRGLALDTTRSADCSSMSCSSSSSAAAFGSCRYGMWCDGTS